MIRRMLRENRTLREMFPGILLYGIVAQIILTLAFPPLLYRAVGLWAGILSGCAMAIHMAWCLETIVALDEKGATAYVRKTTILRYACVCILLLLIGFLKIGDPVSFVLGTLGLKIGAYLQPLTHKVFMKIYEKRTGHAYPDGKEGE
ncbi:MAG: hypothetical protein K5649_03110 [Lachnospiraceae bacterium]|nr:hypothetical protein [Lachnospiraceae bacterium]